ncbi:hypothetical protein Leryth_023564 [Lithospermum erythrorhizon]|nr:hypothetical protein Leryth_023564 [Lithospermum erythrorhizon]
MSSHLIIMQIGFLYNYFTGFILHCRGWKSVFCNPSRPAFLGSAPTNLSVTLIQGTRWSSGLLEVSLSRFCPIIYGIKFLPLLDCMCYSYLSCHPLYCIPVWCFATVPQLCLLRGIPMYPKVSSPWFILFSFVFVSPLAKDLFDILSSGGQIQTWWNEWRIWTIKSVTCYSYGSLDAFLKMVGLREADFLPTNKVADDEQVHRYEMGLFDFQAPMLFLAPLVSLILLNMASFLFGMVQVILGGFLLKDMFGQIFLSFFILIVNYPVIDGMVFRKDKGCIPSHATLVSAALLLGVSLIDFLL